MLSFEHILLLNKRLLQLAYFDFLLKELRKCGLPPNSSSLILSISFKLHFMFKNMDYMISDKN